jgi:four helix bundle protein
MGKIERFEDLDCWKRAREIVSLVYSVSSEGLLNKDFGARDQARRAAISIMNNIAEGFSRTSTKEFIRFLSIAESSAAEVKSMIYVFQDLRYIEESQASQLHFALDDVRQQIRSFIKYLNIYQKK